jgi:hypothetical protein
VILDHLTEAQRRAYVVADNKLALNAGWDDELLAAELHRLNGEGFDLSLMGFSDVELDELMAPLEDEPTSVDGEDDAPNPPQDPVTRPGDMWILGDHRLLCGDATVATDVERLIARGRAICGSWATTVCSAATRPLRPMSNGCSALIDRI